MGRSEPLAGVVGRCTRLARPGSGADAQQLGLPAGISGCFRFAVDGLGGVDVVTEFVTSGSERGGTQADALRRLMQVGGTVGTCWDG